MRRKVLATLVVFVSLFIFSPKAQALLSVDARYWLSEMDAEVKVTESGLIGTEIDFENDLGMDTDKDFFEGRITLEFGKHRVRYAFLPMSWDGLKSITRSINFGGRTFGVSTDVASSLDIDYHRLGYEYALVDAMANRLSLIAELKFFDIDASLESALVSESESIAFGLPTVGVGFQLGLPWVLNISGEITGITYGGDAYMVDGEVGLNITALPLVTISGGYRYLKLYAEVDDDKVDFQLDGPFFMVRAGF